jgi:hypothetical protein
MRLCGSVPPGPRAPLPSSALEHIKDFCLPNQLIRCHQSGVCAREARITAALMRLQALPLHHKLGPAEKSSHGVALKSTSHKQTQLTLSNTTVRQCTISSSVSSSALENSPWYCKVAGLVCIINSM